MVNTKSIEVTKKKWVAARPRIPSAYKEGVEGVSDWQERSLRGQSLYEEQMTKPEVLGRRAKKIAEVSNEEWKRKAADKGARRIAAGMAAAEADYEKGMRKVLDTIRSVDLPDRTSDPMANIDNRVKPIVAALKKLKEE